METGEEILERTDRERERRAELVRDVGKELRLGLVEFLEPAGLFGEFLRPLPDEEFELSLPSPREAHPPLERAEHGRDDQKEGEGTEPEGLPEVRRDLNLERRLGLIPLAVTSRRLHAEDVPSGRDAREVGRAPCARVDPAFLHTVDPVPEADAVGIGERSRRVGDLEVVRIRG